MEPRTYAYISDAKVNELWEQIPPSVLGRLTGGLSMIKGINILGTGFTLGTNEQDRKKTIYSRLDRVEAYLRERVRLVVDLSV